MAADPTDFAKAMRRTGKLGLALGLASIVGGAGTSLAAGATEKAHKLLTMKDNIRGILRENKDLQGLPRREVIKFYDTLWSLNPDYAKDPVIAGAAIRRMSEMPESALAMAPQMIGAREKSVKVRAAKSTIPGAIRGIGDNRSLLETLQSFD